MKVKVYKKIRLLEVDSTKYINKDGDYSLSSVCKKLKVIPSERLS